MTLGAQEAGDVNSETDGAAVRPAETELLLNEEVTEAAAQAPEDEVALPGVGFADLLRMILVLALVIGLIYAFVWFLKRFTSQKAESQEIINLLSTRPLKGDAALHLVEVGSRVFLVGSCSNSVNLVSEIDDAESIDTIRLEASMVPRPVSVGFAKMFKDRFGTAAKVENAEGSPDQPIEKTGRQDSDPASFLRTQRDRLKDL